MVKGTLIFSAGVIVGVCITACYQEPVGEVKEATGDFIRSTKAILEDAWLDVKIGQREAKAKKKESSNE